jgi:hypothetical protein
MNPPKQNGDFLEDGPDDFDIFLYFMEIISLNNTA